MGGVLDYAHYGHWSLYLMSESAILISSATLHSRESNITAACRSLRLLSLGILLCLVVAHRIRPTKRATRDEESAPLLNGDTGGVAENGTAYGSCTPNPDTETVPSAKKSGHPRSKTDGSEDAVDSDDGTKGGFRELAHSFKVRNLLSILIILADYI